MRPVIPRFMLEIRQELENARADDLLAIVRAEHELVCHLAGEIAALKLQVESFLKQVDKK